MLEEGASQTVLAPRIGNGGLGAHRHSAGFVPSPAPDAAGPAVILGLDCYSFRLGRIRR